MSYYDQCRSGVGRPVRITTMDGQTHHGMIHRVTRSKVFLRPMNQNSYGGGFAYPRYRRRAYGWYGFGVGIAIGAIATLAFLPLFFW